MNISAYFGGASASGARFWPGRRRGTEANHGFMGFQSGCFAVGTGEIAENDGLVRELHGGVQTMQRQEAPDMGNKALRTPMDVVAEGLAGGDIAGRDGVGDEGGDNRRAGFDGLGDQAAAERHGRL